MKYAYSIIIYSTLPLLDNSDFDAYSMFPLLGDSGPWQLLNVSITRRFHTLVIFFIFTRRFQYSTFHGYHYNEYIIIIVNDSNDIVNVFIMSLTSIPIVNIVPCRYSKLFVSVGLRWNYYFSKCFHVSFEVRQGRPLSLYLSMYSSIC